MDVGARVRLALPAPGHATARGEVIEVGEKRDASKAAPLLVKWDKKVEPVWYLDGDLVPVDW